MDSLKGETFSPQVFPLFLDAFKVVVGVNFSGENARLLALFVTYALHDSRSFAKRTLRPRPSSSKLRKGAPSITSTGSTPRSSSPSQAISTASALPLSELGIAILGMLAEFLCDRNHSADIQRFAKNVTNKV